VTLKAKQGLERLPTSFAFAKPKLELAGDEHFRYVDADLVAVPATVELERNYGSVRRTWYWWLAAGIVLVAGAFFARKKLGKTEHAAQARFRAPEHVTPFTVLGLLRDIERNNGLAPQEKSDLRAEIGRIEAHYFGDPDGDAPDLGRIASSWVARVT